MEFSIKGILRFLVLSICLGAIKGDLYSSLYHVGKIFELDEMVAQAVSMMQNKEVETEYFFKSHLKLANDLQDSSAEEKQNIYGNPLHIYTLFKRFVFFWPTVLEQLEDIISDDPIESADLKELIEKILLKSKGLPLPTKTDLTGAATALGRLQRVYRIPLEKINSGLIYNTECSIYLSAYDCLRIGKATLDNGFYSGAYQWYAEALKLTEKFELKMHIQDLLDDLAIKHDENWKDHNEEYFPKLIKDMDKDQIITWDTRYNKLCRGIQLIDEDHLSKLRCYLTVGESYFLFLQPVKVEEISHNPIIIMFHDVISDNEILTIKTSARASLMRSGLIGSTKSEARVSKTSWLSEKHHEVVARLSKRVSDITGLHTFEGVNEHMAGESLQVLNYGIGGFYMTHMDALIPYIAPNATPDASLVAGDRIATWMFYLSDVKHGGYTAFDYAGVSAPPVKGSAVFWYNYKRNGEINQLSHHAGCPVLIGQKWVANKWIRSHQNYLRHPCDLDPMI